MVQRTMKTVLRTTVRVLKQCMCPHDETMCPCTVNTVSDGSDGDADVASKQAKKKEVTKSAKNVASKQAKKKASKQAKKKKVTNNGTCPQTMHVST